MYVFLSWSGKTSFEVAKVFRDLLPVISPGIKPFHSKFDIKKGADWRTELEEQFKNTDIGIFFLTKDNINSPWLMHEAGALKTRCLFLFDLAPSEIPGPLNNVQYTLFEKEDIKGLLESLNNEMGDKKLSETCFKLAFDTVWPQLAIKLNRIKIDAEGTKTNADDPKESLIKSYYSTLEKLLKVGDKLSNIKHPLFQDVINKELIEFTNKVNRWETKRATLKPHDKYSDYLLKVYASARKNIFATCTKTCMDTFLSGKLEDDFLRIHEESNCTMTRMFIFEDRKDIQAKYIDRIKMHNGVMGLEVLVYINNEDPDFAFPPDITRDITVIDDGLVIGIADHSSPRTTAQLIFNNPDERLRFKLFKQKLIDRSLKKDDPLYKEIFGEKTEQKRTRRKKPK